MLLPRKCKTGASKRPFFLARPSPDSAFPEPFANVFDQTLRGILDHVEHKVEAVAQPVIRIGHFVVIEVVRKIHEELDLRPLLRHRQALEIEKSLINEINKVENVSKGTDNLLAGLADEAEARIYKIRQRLL